jgi:hypothetical protein
VISTFPMVLPKSFLWGSAIWLLWNVPAIAQQPPVNPENRTANYQPEAVRLCTLSGRVTDGSASAGISGATVTATGRSGSASTTTDSEGKFTLKGLSVGSYGVFSKSQGYSMDSTNIVYVNALPGTNVDDIAVKLFKAGSISGRILDAEKRPAANVSVAVWYRSFHNGHSSFRFRGNAITSTSGEYQISDLPKGRYYLGVFGKIQPVRPPRTLSKTKTPPQEFVPARVFYPNVTSLEAASPIFLRDSEQRRGIDLEIPMVPAFCARGMITHDSRTARTTTPNTAISVYIPSIGVSALTAHGEVNITQPFEICGLQAGDYEVLVLSWSDNKRDVAFQGRSAISIVDKDLEMMDDIDLQKGRSLGAKVVLSDEQSDDPLPSGLTLRLEPISRARYLNETLDCSIVLTGPVRECEFSNLYDDQYFLTELVPEGTYVTGATLSGDDIRHKSFVPSAGELRVVLASDGATLSGQVVDKEDHSVPNASVILVPRDWSDRDPVALVNSDQHGMFRISRGIGPGEYRILSVIGLAEGEAEAPDTIKRLLSQATAVSFSSHETKTILLTVQTPN